jgi:hypothetical protein
VTIQDDIAVVFGSRCFDGVDKSSQVLWQQMANEIWGNLQNTISVRLEKPEFEFVRSHLGRPQAFWPSGGRPTVVFDLHIIDLTFLDAIFRYYPLSLRLKRYAMNILYAERLFAAGRLLEAVLCRHALNEVDAVKDKLLIRQVPEDVNEAIISDSHEQVKAIIAHEIAHSVISSLGLNAHAELGNWYMNVVRSQLTLNAEAPMFTANPIAPSWSTGVELIDQIGSDPLALEEVLCDCLAVLSATPFGFPPSRPGVCTGANIAAAAIPVFRAIDTMLLVRMADVFAQEQRNPSRINELVHQQMARRTMLEMFILTFTNQNCGYEEAMVLDKALSDDAVSDHPALYFFLSDFNVGDRESVLKSGPYWATLSDLPFEFYRKNLRFHEDPTRWLP